VEKLLTGEDPYLQKFQKYLARLPAAPRCKLCMAPFAGPFGLLLRVAGFARRQLNSQLCLHCIRELDKRSGGAEIPVSVLYADVRGSTTIAEKVGATEFTASFNDFYRTTARMVDSEQGVIDHIAGDGMLALWIPAFAPIRDGLWMPVGCWPRCCRRASSRRSCRASGRRLCGRGR
jgi:adenylate cyclase